MLHQHQRWGWNADLAQKKGVGQRAELSVLNSQRWGNMCIKQERLRAGLRPTSQPPEKVLAPSRDQEKHKGWEKECRNKLTSQRRHQHSAEIRTSTKAKSRVGMTDQPPKTGQEWIPVLISGTEGSIQNWINPPCWGRSWRNKDAAERQHSCDLLKTTLTILHELAATSHLTIPTNLVYRRSK
jgi:hypothetical protein